MIIGLVVMITMLKRYREFSSSICIATHVRSWQLALKHASLMMFLLGVLMLSVGLSNFSSAGWLDEKLDEAEAWLDDIPGVQAEFGTSGNNNNGGGSSSSNARSSRTVDIDLTYIEDAVCKLYMLIEGSFGALIMTIAGIGAIASAAFGNYKGSVSMIIVSCGAFTLRSLVSLFFGTIEDCGNHAGAATRTVSNI